MITKNHAEKVVATMDMPSIHQGIFLPDKKNSLEFSPDFFDVINPININIPKKEKIINQSKNEICILT